MLLNLYGVHPILPLDIQEATWLVELPDKVLTRAELIGYRAQALAKHMQHVIEIRQHIDQEKRYRLITLGTFKETQPELNFSST